MSAFGSTREWYLFLGTRSREDASSEVRRMIHRLDDASDAVNFTLRVLAGCPAEDVEEILRIARTSLDEAISQLNQAVYEIRLGDPDVA